MAVPLPLAAGSELPGAETLGDFVALLPLPLVVSSGDGEGRVLLANLPACAMVGVAPAALTGLRVRDFYHDPSDRDRLLALLRRDGAINSFEARLKTLRGTELWALVSARLMRHDGEPVVVVTFQDITDRKRAEQQIAELLHTVERGKAELERRVAARTAELQRARQQLSDAIESISEGFVLWDAEDRLVLCNARYRNEFSFAPELLVAGRRYEEIVREGVRRGALPQGYRGEDWIAERLERHRTLAAPYVVQRADGRWTKMVEYRTEEGGVVGIRTDVTELKRHALALEENRGLLRAVIDAVPAIINVKDPQSRYILMNRFQGEVYGIDPDAAVGRTSVDFVGPVYGGGSVALDRKVVASGAALPFAERDFIDVSGHPHTWFAAKIPLKDAAGAVRNIVTVALDITRLKETERARANLSRYFAPGMVDLLAHADKPFGPARSQAVAVLFVDLVGSTRLSAQLEPRRFFELLRAFHARMTAEVFAAGGSLDKYMGDGVMATFGTPDPGPRDASNALRCALAMQRAMAALNAERNGAGEAPLRIAVGLHYGPALLGNIGTKDRLEFAVIGETVNLASRLERLARPLAAGIVVSDALVAQACAEAGAAPPELAAFARRAPQEVAGFDGRIAIWTAPAGAS